MKKVYGKPTIKSVKLIGTEALLMTSGNGSGNSLHINQGTTAAPSMALSNEEEKHDIWGCYSNSIL